MMGPQPPGALWPLRPRPCPGELFSSWLVRVARCYEMPVETFCRAVWPGRKVWRGDADRQIDDEALRLLSGKTGVTYAELFSLTLRTYEPDACQPWEDEFARNLYFRGAHTSHAIRFCPCCVAERPHYFRRDWRLAFVTVCPRHRLPLLERCESCRAPCLFAKVAVDRPLASCYRCHRYLGGMAKDTGEEMALQIELHVEFQQKVLSVLRKRQPPDSAAVNRL
ncbi:MAG: TniQ family protein [Bryobacteraceae bacterium]